MLYQIEVNLNKILPGPHLTQCRDLVYIISCDLAFEMNFANISGELSFMFVVFFSGPIRRNDTLFTNVVHDQCRTMSKTDIAYKPSRVW